MSDKEIKKLAKSKYYWDLDRNGKKLSMSDREIMNSKPSWSWSYPDTKVTLPKVKHQPDAYKHQVISFIKSGVRILGYGLLIVNLPIAVGVLIFSEVIGIIEELV